MTSFKKILQEGMSEEQQLLSESFNTKPYDVTMTKKGANDILFGFETDQGTEYQVRFRKAVSFGSNVRRVTVRQKQGSTFKDVVKKFDDPMRVMSTLIHSVELFAKTPMGRDSDGLVLDMSKKAAPRASKIFKKALLRNKVFKKFFKLVDTIAVSDESQQTAWAVAKGKKPEDVFTGSDADGMLGDSSVTAEPEPEPVTPRSEAETFWDIHGSGLMRVIKKNPAYPLLKMLGIKQPENFKLVNQSIYATFRLKGKDVFRWKFSIVDDKPQTKYNEFGAVLHGEYSVWDGTHTSDESEAEMLVAKAMWWYCMKVGDWRNVFQKGNKTLMVDVWGKKKAPTDVIPTDGRYLEIKYAVGHSSTIGRSSMYELRDALLGGFQVKPKVVDIEKLRKRANKFAKKYLNKLERTTNSANDQQITVDVWMSGAEEISVALIADQRGYPTAAEAAVKSIVRNRSLPQPNRYDSGQGDDSDYVGDHAYGRAVWVFTEKQIHEYEKDTSSFSSFLKS